MKKKNRRTFLKLIVLGIISFFGIVWNKLTQHHIEILNQKEKVFAFNKNKFVSFYKNYIIINQNNKTTVLSSHCTHLGCTISKVENDKLLCPCHGSEYSLEGKVLKGPAYKNLEIIPAQVSKDGTNIEIL